MKTSFKITTRISAILAAVIFPYFSSASSGNASFETGNEFQIVSVQGRLLVSCSDPTDGSSIASYFCEDSFLSPAEMARFKTSSGVAADRVKLTATRADGSVRSKEGEFDSAKGQSSKPINLWVSTLFQRPLLKSGLNDISYELTRGGESVERGRFQANVTGGPTLTCASGHITSSQADDCRFSQRVCGQYFSQHNWCR
jgi:hypothetical protein